MSKGLSFNACEATTWKTFLPQIKYLPARNEMRQRTGKAHYCLAMGNKIALHFAAVSRSVTILVDEYDHLQTGTLIDL